MSKVLCDEHNFTKNNQPTACLVLTLISSSILSVKYRKLKGMTKAIIFNEIDKATLLIRNKRCIPTIEIVYRNGFSVGIGIASLE
ncbi:unnamed protein product [Lactuca virosa]|uniref:Uncharacterized protein n=1 Tax=Lactuca virosa TaxID=75947 RepID=A0AAU9MGK5_9ASTR|nr:unnamed protein product [Lactuca virosa]